MSHRAFCLFWDFSGVLACRPRMPKGMHYPLEIMVSGFFLKRPSFKFFGEDVFKSLKSQPR
ncbi:hypothetical protein ATCC53582_01647 [Novacetimonas hansenii]|nr:hypothetical protein BGC30_14315 [Novacetimonas hansenii]CUW47530.1 hypothetical protein ATCC53582_01647 [Novacetimonas hansenii]